MVSASLGHKVMEMDDGGKACGRGCLNVQLLLYDQIDQWHGSNFYARAMPLEREYCFLPGVYERRNHSFLSCFGTRVVTELAICRSRKYDFVRFYYGPFPGDIMYEVVSCWSSGWKLSL